MKRKADNNLFYRIEKIERSVDKDSRSVELTFSSEQPVKRWFGDEILLHGADNADFSRLNEIGSVLLNHNPDKIIGRIEKAWLDGRRGKASIVFDDDEDGSRAMKKVQNGSLKGVSVGYMPTKFREVQPDEEFEGIKGPAYVATRWTAYEITLTPVPADGTVGVGRELTRSLDGIEIIKNGSAESVNRKTTKEEKRMTPEEIKKMMEEMFARMQAELSKGLPDMVRSVIKEDAKPKQLVPADKAQELLARAKAISAEEQAKVAQMVFEGRSETEIVNHLLDIRLGATDAKDTGGVDPTKSKGTEKRDVSEEDILAAFSG